MHNGQQQHCHDWGRSFVRGFEHAFIAEDARARIERVLVERMS